MQPYLALISALYPTLAMVRLARVGNQVFTRFSRGQSMLKTTANIVRSIRLTRVAWMNR